MGLFEHWPYVNFHDLNLDWVIKEIPKVFASRDEAQASAEASAESAAASQLSADASQLSASASQLSAEASQESAQASQESAESIENIVDQVDTNTQRIDNILVQGTPTEGNAELIDIRVAGNGVTYTTAGDAVRGQYDALKDAIISGDEFLEEGKYRQHLTFEYGTISPDTGENDGDANNRARLNGLYETKDTAVYFDRSQYPYSVYPYYYDANGTFITRGTRKDSSPFIPAQQYKYFRIAFLLAGSGAAINLDAAEEQIYFVKEIPWKASELDVELDTSEHLYYGNMVNLHLTASGLVDDNLSQYRISSKSIVAFPNKYAHELKVKINPEYMVAIRSGNRPQNLNHNTYFKANGETITIPEEDMYYAVSIKNASETDVAISPEEDHGLELRYFNPDLYENINPADSVIMNNSRYFFSATERNRMDKYCIISHTSDPHADYERVKTFIEYSEQNGFDFACVTGDIVAYTPAQGMDWFKDIINNHNIIAPICPGNHDVYNSQYTNTEVYDLMFKDAEQKTGNSTLNTWYYTDSAEKMIRVISLNLYEYGGDNRTYTHFSQAQINFLINALLTAPAGYGVVLLYHSPQASVANAKDPVYPKFFQDIRKYNSLHNSVNGNPIADIIDAFISRGTINETYTQTGSPASFTAEADFTAVNNGVEFIAHLTGHLHEDTVCYLLNTQEKQLMLNVVCTTPSFGGSSYPYLNDVSDLGRSETDATQNAFNVYVIDRDNKVVKITRIGCSKNYNLDPRDFMVIPYI